MKCRHKQTNSPVSTPLNASKNAMKIIHWRMRMVGPEFYFRNFFLDKAAPQTVLWTSKSDFCRKWHHPACSIHVILSKNAVLEWLLRRPVTIVRDTRATSSSQSLMIQRVCMTGNLSEVRYPAGPAKYCHCYQAPKQNGDCFYRLPNRMFIWLVIESVSLCFYPAFRDIYTYIFITWPQLV